ncbi:electron transfer flavoprotein subunit beta/FixA family protein [Zhaonella formicivorans]|jgi:electron transfer flavoprotein beta subunit|uniref:electron transfer flavoprotein subunit beta/FixA family protein n=1 Tax=Zhaonella formicivorans TaxID=2528593 RepID=UPI0010E10F6F|nr:electron transfer flavoprotein subunit beta/FixA family protein [Zhaonella formicivorans]
MHFVVCVKQVPDTAEVRVDPKTNTLVREGVPSIINPYDAHAVEAAVQLKEIYGGKVTVICMGPPQAEEVLRRSISFGADEAILLSDRKFAGADTLATSLILTEGILKLHREQPVDLVLCGKQAIDGDTAQVGPGIAARLGWPQLTYVMKIESLDLDKKTIIVHRKLEGQREIVSATLPALLTVVKDINELRYASLPDLLRSVRFTPRIWSKDDLGLDESRIGLKGSPTAVRKIFPPPERPQGEMLKGTPREMARELVEKLVTTKIIADK